MGRGAGVQVGVDEEGVSRKTREDSINVEEFNLCPRTLIVSILRRLDVILHISCLNIYLKRYYKFVVMSKTSLHVFLWNTMLSKIVINILRITYFKGNFK